MGQQDIIIRSKEIKLVSVKEINLNPNNRNGHSKEQIDRLAQIIAYQGFRNPVTISNRTGVLIAGEGRYLAAKQLGIKEIPAIYQDFESEEQEYAYGISDNSIASWSELDLAGINLDLGDLGPDFDIDLLGLKDFVLDVAEKLEPQCDEEETPINVETRTKPGDLFRLGHHRLMCGDSTDISAVDRLMENVSADLIFTSPPYGQQRDYGAAKEKVQEWDALMRDVFSIIPAHEETQILVNLGLIHRDGEWVPYWDSWIQFMRESGWKRFGHYVWDQGPGLPGDWNGRLAPAHEFIFHFNKKPRKPNKTKECAHAGEANHGSGLRGKNGDVSGYSHAGKSVQSHKIPDSVIRVMRHKARGIETGHPAVFSVALVEEMTAAYSDPGEVLFEPFAGSGTTAIACEKLGRKAYMMELDPKYCDIILARWESFTGQKAELING